MNNLANEVNKSIFLRYCTSWVQWYIVLGISISFFNVMNEDNEEKL